MQKIGPPFTVRATKVTDSRVTGPPSLVYPALRDLVAASAEAVITIEVDTEERRYRGILRHCHPALGSQERLIFQNNKTVLFKRVLAFRVLSIEVDDDVKPPFSLS